MESLLKDNSVARRPRIQRNQPHADRDFSASASRRAADFVAAGTDHRRAAARYCPFRLEHNRDMQSDRTHGGLRSRSKSYRAGVHYESNRHRVTIARVSFIAAFIVAAPSM
jgi:hypothetical protein